MPIFKPEKIAAIPTSRAVVTKVNRYSIIVLSIRGRNVFCYSGAIGNT